MDDLPELPFEKVLSYLSLEDRIKARAVSRRWYHQINRFKVKTLCYSDLPAGFIWRKSRLVSGSFAQNFICSTRFAMFSATFRPTILSNLKHLRLCDLRLNNKKTRKSFARALQSFGQLEQLDIIRLSYHPNSGPNKKFKLTLPMLTSIRLEKVRGLSKLTLDAPQLLKIKVSESYDLRLELVHGESVEWLMIDEWTVLEMEKMKNLKYLYLGVYLDEFNPAFLSSFEQLKEICLSYFEDGLFTVLFEQKQQHGRTDLKIYLQGLLLNGPDPALHSLQSSDEEFFSCLAENPSRLADQIPFWYSLGYSRIERVAPKIEMSSLKRFTDLSRIDVFEPVEDTERFLGLLKNLDGIEQLVFESDQPQDLFDRLPEHCAVQSLTISKAPSDYRFLFRLKHLMELILKFPIDVHAIRKVLEENEFLSYFYFQYLGKEVRISIEYPKQFLVSVDGAWREVRNLDAAIELITADS